MIAVTGARGFIGQAVITELAKRGQSTKVLDLPEHDVRGITRCDIEGCDGVINLAGALGTTETIGLDRSMVDVNVLGALAVADACRQAGVPMVQIGTGHKGHPNVYAITKACAEDLLLSRAQWLGQPITVVRAFHAYGPGQKAPRPYGPGHVTKIVPNFVCRALAGDPLPIHGDGQQVVDLVHVSDVAYELVEALTGPYGVVVEAGTGIGTTVLQAAQDVVRLTGSRSQIRHVATPAGFIPGARLVAADIKPDYIEWLNGLPSTIDYYRGVHA